MRPLARAEPQQERRAEGSLGARDRLEAELREHVPGGDVDRADAREDVAETRQSARMLNRRSSHLGRISHCGEALEQRIDELRLDVARRKLQESAETHELADAPLVREAKPDVATDEQRLTLLDPLRDPLQGDDGDVEEVAPHVRVARE